MDFDPIELLKHIHSSFCHLNVQLQTGRPGSAGAYKGGPADHDQGRQGEHEQDHRGDRGALHHRHGQAQARHPLHGRAARRHEGPQRQSGQTQPPAAGLGRQDQDRTLAGGAQWHAGGILFFIMKPFP